MTEALWHLEEVMCPFLGSAPVPGCTWAPFSESSSPCRDTQTARLAGRIPGRGVNPNLTNINQNGKRSIEENPQASLASLRVRADILGLWRRWLLARRVGESSTALRLGASPPTPRGKLPPSAPYAAFLPPPSTSWSNVRLPQVIGAY